MLPQNSEVYEIVQRYFHFLCNEGIVYLTIRRTTCSFVWQFLCLEQQTESDLISSVASKPGTERTKKTTCHPASNGLVECFHRKLETVFHLTGTQVFVYCYR